MTKVPQMQRRHFLLGTGGLVLAIPTLSSLLPLTAHAQSARQRRFVAMGTDQGGVFPRNMYPDMPADASTKTLYSATASLPKHDIRHAPLTSRIEGADRVISNTLRAPASRLTDALIRKMNVMTGFDITTYIGHNRQAFIGNYAANDQGADIHGLMMPTIDQIIARSASFNLSPVKQPTINFARGHGASADPLYCQAIDLELQAVQATTYLSPLLALLATDTQPVGRPPERLVHRVYEHYRSLSTGAHGDASRLSAEDKRRLTRHMDLLSALESRLSLRIDCGAVPGYRDSDNTPEQLRMAVDLTAMALMCGAVNAAVITTDGEPFHQDTNYTNWHHQVVHEGGGPEESAPPELQRINYRAQQSFFSEVFVRLAAALDVEEEDGITFLDNSLLYWTQECGRETHTCWSQPVITAGGAAGYFNTGRFIDYRNHENPLLGGVLYNQFLANVLQGMGIAPTEYRRYVNARQPGEIANGMRGYGVIKYHDGNFWQSHDIDEEIWPERYYRDADTLLTGWVNGA